MINFVRVISISLCAVIFLFCLVACSNDNDRKDVSHSETLNNLTTENQEITEQDIVGIWNSSNSSVYVADNYSFTIKFSEGGNYFYKEVSWRGTIESSGNWIFEDGIIKCYENTGECHIYTCTFDCRGLLLRNERYYKTYIYTKIN